MLDRSPASFSYSLSNSVFRHRVDPTGSRRMPVRYREVQRGPKLQVKPPSWPVLFAIFASRHGPTAS